MNQIFSVGEKVVALTNPEHLSSQKRVRGNLYIVKSILYCSACGCQMIYIGGTSSCAVSNEVICFCGNSQPRKGLYWTASKNFARLEEISDAIAHFAEKEEYETCEMLKGVEEKMLVNKDVNK